MGDDVTAPRYGGPVPAPPGPTQEDVARYWHGFLSSQFATMHDLSRSMAANLERLAYKRDPRYEDVLLCAPAASPATGDPFIVHEYNYKYLDIWSPASVTLLIATRGLSGSLAVSACVWTKLDLTDQSILTIAAGTQSVVLRWSNERYL